MTKIQRGNRWRKKHAEALVEKILAGTATVADIKRAERLWDLMESMRLNKPIRTGGKLRGRVRAPRHWPMRPTDK